MTFDDWGDVAERLPDVVMKDSRAERDCHQQQRSGTSSDDQELTGEQLYAKA
ncbi:MAG: hypothetical protein M0T77_05615 [Actinomycetota bacterium]|nr:hypothetical protein [Actinomycetota bacterium]